MKEITNNKSVTGIRIRHIGGGRKAATHHQPKLIEELVHSSSASLASQYGGWLTFSYAFMQFLVSPILGNLSDQYGRRPILLFSLFGFGIDYLFVAFAYYL